MNMKKVVSSKSLVVSPLVTNAQRPTPNSSRRGILLLVVLSMLTLFLLLGTAYIVSANHYRKTNKILAKVTEASNSSVDQVNLLEEVLNQIVRDTNNQNSSLRFHSLLRDMYGNDGLLAEINVSNWAGGNVGLTGGQMIQFQLNLTTITDQFGIPYSPTTKQLSQINHAYNGLVLTFLDGPVRGQSTRIVGYIPAVTGATPSPAIFRVMAPRKADGSNIVAADFTKLDASRILINGRPFNGTGAGYDPTNTSAGTAKLSTTELVAGLNPELALVPNAAFIDHTQFNTNGPGTYGAYFSSQWASLSPLQQQRLIDSMGLVGQGGSDESYDAVDFQNMFLAALQTNPVETMLQDLSDPDSSDLGTTVIPSNHRPALINYWKRQLAGGATELYDEPNLLRKVLLRPNWLDHPDFTGSNPDLLGLSNENRLRRAIYGPWDVDNDNDGIRDSVWVDFGATVMENADGRLVKPMAAIMILDMDGRLNLNSHGSVDIANADPNPSFSQPIAGTGNTTNILSQGQGYGTPEISLGPILGKSFEGIFRGLDPADTNITDIDISRIKNRLKRKRRGKYGMGTASAPGKAGNYNQAYDAAAQVKMQGMPKWANGKVVIDASGTEGLGGYATPPDLRGRYALGLNDLGQPVYEALFDNKWMNADSPYEVDLSLGASRGESETADDGAYSMAEMERVLRAYDADAGTLPSRIWKLAGEFMPNTAATTPDLDDLNLWRTTLTTDSYDLPVPSVVVPGWMVVGPNGVADAGPTSDDFEDVMDRPPVGLTFADLLEYRIRVGIGILNPNTITPVQRQNLRASMAMLLPQDLADGLRLDINRPFGNGRDDNNNGVVDEPGEDEGSFWASGNSQLSGFTGPNGQFRDAIDRDGDGTITALERGDTDGSGSVNTLAERIALHNFRRQMLARDLYVMAMTLVDPFDLTTVDGKAKARKLAQWAINVVDYRDPDNIMTAFEYDENPFDGWEVDGDLSTDEGTPAEREFVWGAERPELVITETLAWHDRRAENGTQEVSPGSIEKASLVGTDQEDDSDFDQEVRPQGVGFIELLNPWQANSATNADTHAIAGLSTRGGAPEGDWDNDGTNDTAGDDKGVNIAAVDQLTGSSPVWRISVYKTANATKPAEVGGPDKDPDALKLADQAQGADRTIYMAGFDPNYASDGVAYFNDDTQHLVPSVRPGSYMVIGAGKSSGGNKYLAPFGARTGQVDESNRGILLDTTAASGRAVAMMSSSGQPVQDADGFANSAPTRMCTVAVINKPVGFSFSEPPGGYLLSAGAGNLVQFSSGSPVQDTPLDDQRVKVTSGIGLGGAPAGDLRNRDGESRLRLPTDGAGGGLGGAAGTVPAENARRTIPGFSWIYLQRLSNPLLPWNPPVGIVGHDNTKPVNDYLTIDSMGVNVTVFNGLINEETRKESSSGGTSASLARYDNDQAVDSFASVQRGRTNLAAAAGDPPKVDALVDLQIRALSDNRSRSLPSEPDVAPAVAANLWAPEMIGKVGAIKRGFMFNRAGPTRSGKQPNNNSYNFKGIPDCTLGFLNEPFRRPNPTGGLEAKKEPASPFPWITWNNRPFANAGEIMEVPAFRSSQMLQAFSMRTAATQKENYDGDVLKLELSSTLTLGTDGPYGHLLNFFRTDSAGPDNIQGNADDRGIAGLYRMLDYIHVPSPFVKTETWLNPTRFGSTVVSNANDPRYQRQPPFNRIAQYREPGRVNLNTMVSPAVYEGLMHGVTSSTVTGKIHPGPTWNRLNDSRRGFGTATQPMLQLQNDSPTFFTNPFRLADAADLVPLQAMRRTGIDCTMQRSEAGTAGATPNATGDPLFAAATANAYNNALRNPYFRYQPMTRLSSMTTNRSNVYAVWITVGFFEVEEAPDRDTTFKNLNDPNNNLSPAQLQALYDKVYPDGYAFGKEAGSDTGDIRRVREFAMIDRTVPVAFEPGKNHNIDKAIRLRRRID